MRKRERTKNKLLDPALRSGVHGRMVRRSVPAKAIDDIAFPIRVKVKVPERGFGARIDLYHAWLQSNLSAGDKGLT